MTCPLCNPLTPRPGSEKMDQCVLSCIMQAPDVNFAPALEALKPSDFSTEQTSLLFDTLRGMHSRSEPIDPVTVAQSLIKAALLERIGGASYVSECYTASPNPADLRHYMTEVLEASRKRQALTAVTAIAAACYKDGDWRSAVSPLLKGIEVAMTQAAKKDLRSVTDVMETWMTEYGQAGPEGADPPVATGIAGLDKLLVGGVRKEYYLIGGFQGHGKTLLAQQIAGKLANAGRAGMWVGWEMRDVQVLMRDLARESRVPLDIVMGRATADAADFQRLTRRAGEISKNWRLKFSDDPYMTLETVASHARDLKRRGLLDYMALDFLQLAPIAKASGQRRDEALTEASNFVSRLQLELGITVIAMVQLNDDDLIRDARGILDAVQVYLRIKMDTKGDGEADEDILDTGKIIVVKSRFGVSDKACPVVRNGPLQRFDDGEFKKREPFSPRRPRKF